MVAVNYSVEPKEIAQINSNIKESVESFKELIKTMTIDKLEILHDDNDDVDSDREKAGIKDSGLDSSTVLNETLHDSVSKNNSDNTSQ
jgi:hypothetical protein